VKIGAARTPARPPVALDSERKLRGRPPHILHPSAQLVWRHAFNFPAGECVAALIDNRSPLTRAADAYQEATLNRQQAAARIPAADALVRRIRRLADRELQEFCNEHEYAALACARAIVPEKSETILQAYRGLAALMNTEAPVAGEETEEDERLELLLALGDLLRLLRLAPALEYMTVGVSWRQPLL
jgi:hypothetical protein